MAAEVLGISGSPVPDSNTDRAVKCALEATGLSTEFVKLSDLRMQPCRACLGCKDTNKCVVEDDAQALAERFRTAKAFVLGAYTPYSSLDARTKMFMERMYCLRHQTGLNRGKIGAAVITTACSPEIAGMPPAYETAVTQIGIWMMEEGMNNLGSMVLLGNVPCIRCGYGDQCEMSAVKMLGGAEATVASFGVHRFETNEILRQNARELGQKIRAAVQAGS
ncbi:MAG: flavodoxin family protein [Candidatus Korobacteraceae bacterium]|jgi:multimeric flavodoxin WrbA